MTKPDKARRSRATKILLVDDSIAIRKTVRISLEEGEYELITTDNAKDALAMAGRVTFDLLMVNAELPGGSGYDVCRGIKADPRHAGIPVVLLTSAAESVDEAKAAEIGAVTRLCKPFDSASLIAACEAANLE
jgi:DNA-binding response OmpR family regulator